MTSQQIDFIHKHVVGNKPTCLWTIQERLQHIPNIIKQIITNQHTPQHLHLKQFIRTLMNIPGAYACIFQQDREYFIIYKYDGVYNTLQSPTLTLDYKKIVIHYYIIS